MTNLPNIRVLICFSVGMFSANFVSSGLIPGLFTLGKIHPVLPGLSIFIILGVFFFGTKKTYIYYIRYFLFGFTFEMLALGFNDFAIVLNTKWRNPLEETTALYQKLFLASYSGLIERMLTIKERYHS